MCAAVPGSQVSSQRDQSVRTLQRITGEVPLVSQALVLVFVPCLECARPGGDLDGPGR